MKAKEYLSQAYLLDQQIKSKAEQIESLRLLSTKVTTTLSPTPHCSKSYHNHSEDAIVKMMDLESELVHDMNNLISLKLEIKDTIQKVTSKENKLLLELRYLSCKAWSDIAIDLSMSLRTVHRVHSDALRDVDHIIRNINV